MDGQTWEDWSGLQDFGFLKICQHNSFRCLNKRLKYCLGPLQSNLFNTDTKGKAEGLNVVVAFTVIG